MRFAFPLGAVLALPLLASPAFAHPHVWVKSKATILYDPAGRVTAIRQGWTFDEAYSAYAVQGFPKDPEGKLLPEKMAELAKINIESLAEQGYFTNAKANGTKLTFGEPVNYGTSFENNALTLTFELPVQSPAKADRVFALDVYDPTFFVDFAIPEAEDAVKLDGAPKGCALKVTRPKPPDQKETQSMSESFFKALNAASQYGAQFASRVLVACP
jgi:ABC-type uncharacterized transport system substrate-binding protein